MGQCYSQVKSNVPRNLSFNGHQSIAQNKSTKKTLRGDEDEGGANVQTAIRSNLVDGSEIYRGMRVNGVLQELSQDDLLLAVKSGSSHVVEALCTKYRLTNVCEIRGINGTFEVLRREIYDISNWNLLLIAIAYDHLFAIKMFSVTLKSHLRIALRTPPVSQFSKVQESDPAHAETFSLMLAINNRSESMLKFIWSDLRLLWDSFHFTYVLSELASQRFVEGIRTFLRSQTSHEIYLSMHVQEKLQFLKAALANDKRYQRKWTLEVKECLKEELTGQHPYATVAIFVLLNDQSQSSIQGAYNLNRLHMERALGFMDATEYGRFKHTSNRGSNNNTTSTGGNVTQGGQTKPNEEEDYARIVTLRIAEYSQQEESSGQRVFGEKLRHKLEQLDQDVVKLRAPALVSSMDFEQIMGAKIFQLAEQGQLREFCDIIDTNDVRLFTLRKRYETTKLLPQNLLGIKRYCYFTPLLVAIQYKQHALVSFIIEKMKVPLRQSLCLFPNDPGSNSTAIDSVNEEYQSYALLVAAANKDEQMLRYLWQCLGGYLWTERHFEPLMRVLIEIQWIVGIKAILQSEMTHDMIRALSSEERSYFVENMIGDIFSFGMGEGLNSGVESSMSSELPQLGGKIQGQLIIAQTIKDELTRQPYAGLFILYMIERFEEMSEEDFAFWDKCCQISDDSSKLFENKPLPKRYEDESDDDEIRRMAGDEEELEIQPPKYGLYNMELVLLSKSNQSRFSQFILDFGIHRKDDRFRQEALKFIECLGNLPEYVPLIEEGTEEAIQNGDEEVKFLKKDIRQAEEMLKGSSKNIIDVTKFTITGNLKQLQQKLIQKDTPDGGDLDNHQLTIQLLSTRGLAVKAYDPSRDHCVLNTREWNPLHYAIYFQQYRSMKYLIEDCGLQNNLAIAMSHCRSQNEFVDDKTFDDIVLYEDHQTGQLTHSSHLYGLMLAIFSKNLAILRYLYEESNLEINGIETDIFPLLKLCINSHWPAGFLLIINSNVTQRVFLQSRLDQKEEFVCFALIECERLVSQQSGGAKTGVQSQTDEDIVREVKDRMTEHPFSCLSWLYFDTVHKELKNHRYIKRLLESTSFNLEALEVLAISNQLERVIRQCEKPRINVQFLNSVYGRNDTNSQDQEKDELVERNRQQDIINQKIHDHKMTYVKKVEEMLINGGQTAQQILKMGSQYPETCHQIITQVLQKTQQEMQPLERFKKFETLLAIPQTTHQTNDADQQTSGRSSSRKTLDNEAWKATYQQRMTMMIRFVSGYNNTEEWREGPTGDFAAKFPHAEPQRFNLFQWIIFYNDHSLMNQILQKTPTLHIPQALSGDHPLIEYQLSHPDGKPMGQALTFEKVGLLLALVRRSIECLKIILMMPKSLLNSVEVLQLSFIIANEQPDLWLSIVKVSNEGPKLGTGSGKQQSLETYLYQLIECAFAQTPLHLRSNWLLQLLKCQKSPLFLESIFKNTTQFKQYCQWLIIGPISDDPTAQDIRVALRKLHGIQLSHKDADYDSIISRLDFLARLKPPKVESQLAVKIGGNALPSGQGTNSSSSKPVDLPIGAMQPKETAEFGNKNQMLPSPVRVEDIEEKESAEIDSD